VDEVDGYVENGEKEKWINISVAKLGRLWNRCEDGNRTNVSEISSGRLDSFRSEYGPVAKSVACINVLPG
jgi:hypothetical protein